MKHIGFILRTAFLFLFIILTGIILMGCAGGTCIECKKTFYGSSKGNPMDKSSQMCDDCLKEYYKGFNWDKAFPDPDELSDGNYIVVTP